jgi:hypothetical protein
MTDGDDSKAGKNKTIADPVAARHEESVLFTVGALGAMRGRPAPAPAQPPPQAPVGEAADGESGFINLSNLAGAAGFVRGEAEPTAQPAAAPQSSAEPQGDAESGFINLNHLSAFGRDDTDGAPTMGPVPQLEIPMGVPMGNDGEGDTRNVKIAIGVALLLLLIALTFLTYVLMTRDEPAETRQRPSNIVVISEPIEALKDAGLAVTAPVVPKQNIPEPDAEVMAAADAAADPVDASPSQEDDAGEPVAAIADTGAASPPEPDVDKIAAPAADPNGKKPYGLNRTQVKTVIAAHRAQVDTCGGERRGGTVIVRFTILPTGGVGGARVINDKKGSPESTCVAGIVKDMKFPEFSGASITINYPFVLPER